MISSGISITFVAPRLSAGTGLGDHTRQLITALQAEGWAAAQGELNDMVGVTEPGAIIWVQMVPYAWGANGVPRRDLLDRVVSLGKGRTVVVYFHELWVGEQRGARWRHTVLGFVQKWRVLRWLKVLRPALVLTSNANYQAILSHASIEAKRIPLPSNLPAPSTLDRDAASSWLNERVDPTRAATAEFGVLFGAIHPEWDGSRAVAAWLTDTEARGRTGVLLVLGHNGPASAAILARLVSATGACMVRGGPLSPGLLAALIARCTVAFATTPWALIGKSGTVQAFRQLGVPVIVTRDDWRWRKGPTVMPVNEPGLRQWSEAFDWNSFRHERFPAGEAFNARELATMLGGLIG